MRIIRNLDGRHKLAVIGALVAWMVSVYFSKVGFSLDAPNSQWLGWVLAGIITVVELVFNSKTQKLSLTLIGVGILCYLYGIWTNVTGFWAYQNPGIAFHFSQESILSVFVGIILEVLPEPLFMWGIGSEFEGDLLGNLAGLWSGNLDYAQPRNSSQSMPREFHPPQNNTPVSNNPFIPKPEYKVTSFGKKGNNRPKPNKMASQIFNDNYTRKFKQ